MLHMQGQCHSGLPIHTCFVAGAQIIDLMMLVVDATKGMQTQTAEVSMCVIGSSDLLMLK